jgi:hypothetical protein
VTVRPDSFSAYRYCLLLEQPERIEAPKNCDWIDTIGILTQLSADPKNPLSRKQLYHWRESLLPLLNVECEGPFGFHEDGSSSCGTETPLNDEEFRRMFEEDDSGLCSSCRHDVDRFHSSD